jgi:acyl dehydratase
MTLDEFLHVGETQTLGSHTFTPEAIIDFAKKFDPQPFHLSEEAAKKSVFGALCASGWHTASTWMKYNVAAGLPARGGWTGEDPSPAMQVSPGFKDLKWLKPVFAGETITYTRKFISHRPMGSRPGYHIVTLIAEGFDSKGDKVIEFENAVVLKAG